MIWGSWGWRFHSLSSCEVPVVMVFGGCMGAIVAMEIVLKADPKQLGRPKRTFPWAERRR